MLFALCQAHAFAKFIAARIHKLYARIDRVMAYGNKREKRIESFFEWQIFHLFCFIFSHFAIEIEFQSEVKFTHTIYANELLL